MQDKMKKLYEKIEIDAAYSHAMTLLSWDLETQAAKESVEGISKTLSILSKLSYDNYVNEDFKNLLYSIEVDKLDEVEKKIVEKLKKAVFEKMEKIPADEYSEYVKLIAEASSVWERAKNENNYEIFKPYLKKLIDTNKRFITYRGYKEHPYDVLLDDNETELTVSYADTFFKLLKEELGPFILKIKGKKEKELKDIKAKLSKYKFDIEIQKKLNKELAQILGFDFSKGVLAESEHPFTTEFNNKDVRFTTHYYENDVLSGIYSTVHETGHAIYEQQIDDKYNDTHVLSGGTTMGIHEAQSRFYENVIGKHEKFAILIKDLLQKYFGVNDISEKEYILLINEYKTQFIRIEADELTYPMHVLVRYEIEKYIFEDLKREIDLDDLSKMWDDMYEKYLGIRPKDYVNGILQDSHWSGGLFGYFPSYALGSAYASQMYEAMSKKFDVAQMIEQRNFAKINEFLKEYIHKYGSFKTPKELIKIFSGEDFNPQYYINYLKDKFTKIYLSEE